MNHWMVIRLIDSCVDILMCLVSDSLSLLILSLIHCHLIYHWTDFHEILEILIALRLMIAGSHTSRHLDYPKYIAV